MHTTFFPPSTLSSYALQILRRQQYTCILLYLVRSPVPNHGCRNLYRNDFSICFELLRITCQKMKGGEKNRLLDGERYLQLRLLHTTSISSRKCPEPQKNVNTQAGTQWKHTVYTLKSFCNCPNPEKQRNNQKLLLPIPLSSLKKSALPAELRENPMVFSHNKILKKYHLFHQHLQKNWLSARAFLSKKGIQAHLP